MVLVFSLLPLFPEQQYTIHLYYTFLLLFPKDGKYFENASLLSILLK